MERVYGPVPSWRLGRSLGIDPVSTHGKTCSFDCLYCQLGRTVHPLTERRRFVEPEALRRELAQVGDVAVDTVTFSGVAEPTLALNLAELVAVVRERFTQPVAILTNSSLMKRDDVRRDLARFDIVVAKVDAPDEALFQQINRPAVSYTLQEILWGIQRFRQEFGGKLALQMMFIPANRDRAAEMAEIACQLRPDEVQLNTPLRPSPVPPLSPAEMDEVEAAFAGLPVVNVYKAKRPEVTPLNERETRRRRPILQAQPLRHSPEPRHYYTKRMLK
jgi:wyosine [tRNA(Phe)-imidazoG37] synthetase (radical SAM superfamily)